MSILKITYKNDTIVSLLKQRAPEFIKGFSVGLLLIIGTFPENYWSYFAGIDPPLAWVFNHLYTTGLEQGKHIIFPHGPLAFFMYPLQPTVFITTIFTSVLKLFLVFNIFRLVDQSNKYKWVLAFVFSYGICIVATFTHILLIVLILFYVNYFNEGKNLYKLLSFLVTAIGFYVKMNVAVISGIITFSFLCYFLYKERNLKKTGLDILLIIGLLIGIWLLMFHSLMGFIHYFVGLFNLSQDNSSAASYYLYNSWWALSGFLILIITLPCINRTKKSVFYSVLTVLSLFSVWKYGMAREDLKHFNWFLIYVLLALLVFIIFENKNQIKTLIISGLAIFLLNINMSNSVGYESPKYEFFGANNFVDFILKRTELNAKAEEEINKNISIYNLPKSILDSIGSATVDVYPWDYAVISANHLNWQPRVVLHSYAAYTSWLDRKDAEHFNSPKAPQFLVLQSQEWFALNGGNLNSIDHRYILNDEPQMIVEILKKYRLYYKESRFLIFRKRIDQVQTSTSVIGKSQTKWGTWVGVPAGNEGLLRAKLKFVKSATERLKSFFYKDEQFWIYLKLSDGMIHKYRIVPKNAEDGVWINPYILTSNNNVIDPTVDSIMFKASNQSILNNNLTIEWERIDFNNDPDFVNKFFNKTEQIKESVILTSANNFETDSINYWSTPSKQDLTGFQSLFGKKSQIIRSKSYSSAFSFPLDSLQYGNLKILYDCWVLPKNYRNTKDALLVVSVENNAGNVYWKGFPIDDQIIDNNQWNHLFAFTDFKLDKPNCTLKVYLWNNSNNEIQIDDFRIVIKK